MPGGSSFGCIYNLRKAVQESEYAFDVGLDEFEEMRDLVNYKKYMDSITNIAKHTYLVIILL